MFSYSLIIFQKLMPELFVFSLFSSFATFTLKLSKSNTENYVTYQMKGNFSNAYIFIFLWIYCEFYCQINSVTKTYQIVSTSDFNSSELLLE